MEGDIKMGKSALNDLKLRMKAKASARQQLGDYVGLITTGGEAINAAFVFQDNSICVRKTLFIAQQHIRNAFELIRCGWEDIFAKQAHGDHPQLAWASICAPMLKNVSSRQFVRNHLLRDAGLSDSTATMHGCLLARIAPPLLIAIAIMDGAKMHLTHTHQKDIVIRMLGIRLQIIITQFNCTSYCAIDVSHDQEMKGTYPLSDAARAFLKTGQTWTHGEGITSSSDLYSVLQCAGFCSADREFLSLGFLQQQFITHAVATRYLDLAVQAYEIVILHVAKADESTSGAPGDIVRRREESQNAFQDLSELLCCEFFEKLGRPNTARLRAQIVAIRLQQWVSSMMKKHKGKVIPSEDDWRSYLDPPAFLTRNPSYSEAPNLAHIGKGAGVTTAANTDDSTNAKLDNVHSSGALKSVLSRDEHPQAASAWLSCWSICRMLAHVQIVPAFLGTHVSDADCWVS